MEREVAGNTVFGEGVYSGAEGDRAFYDAALKHSTFGFREDEAGNITVGGGESVAWHIAGPSTEAVRELDAAVGNARMSLNFRLTRGERRSYSRAIRLMEQRMYSPPPRWPHGN